MDFKVAFTHPDARAPYRARSNDAGFDLFAVESQRVESGKQCIVETGIAIQIPDDCYARVAPRSGLAARYSIATLAGVVDASYRDSIKVILFNHGPVDHYILKGDRIAQIIFERIYAPPELQIVTRDELNDTSRGLNGFGSSGAGEVNSKS
jgi:dUTP pyrophosphatase